jgi:hypothetical protein
LRFNRVVRAQRATLFHFHSWSQPSVDAWKHHRAFRVFHILADLVFLLDLALNWLKLSVAIRIRDGTYNVEIGPDRAATGCTMLPVFEVKTEM